MIYEILNNHSKHTGSNAHVKTFPRDAIHAEKTGKGGRNIFFLDRREMNFFARVPVKYGNDAPWVRSRTTLSRSSADGHLVGSP